MSRFLKFVLLLLAPVLIISCKDEDDNVIKPPVTLDIIESALTDPNLSIFIKALDKVNLTTTLKQTGPFTVLAPNNDAFNTLYTELGVTGLDDIPEATLTNLLSNHILPDTKLSTSNLTSGQGKGYQTTLATGSAVPNTNLNIFFDTTNGVIFNGISSTISGKEDIEATNGFLHQVASVITLPTVLEFLSADTNFDSLQSAISRPEQTAILESFNEESNTPLTVFAPDNMAFTALYEELFSDLNDPEAAEITLETIDSLVLTNTLSLHIVVNMNIRTEQLKDDTITTLGGQTITSNTSEATLTDNNARKATITTKNLQATDGVIHVLDKVLLPKK